MDCGFHVFDCAGFIVQDGVHIGLAFAIRFERVVVAVDQECGTGQKAGIHAHAFAGVGLDQDEALPALAVALDFGLQLLEKAFLEFQDLLHIHAGEDRVGGGYGSIGDDDVLKFVVARRQDGSALVYLGGVQQIEHGKMLDG